MTIVESKLRAHVMHIWASVSKEQQFISIHIPGWVEVVVPLERSGDVK